MKRFLSVFYARNLEFVRDRGSLGFNILFPLLIVIGFGFAFSGKPKDLYKVAVLGSQSDLSLDSDVMERFLKTPFVQFVPVDNLNESIDKVKHHQFDLLISNEEKGQNSPLKYWINDSSPQGAIAEKLLEAATKSVGQNEILKESVTGQQIRYVDWLIAGLLSMNMMFSALFGVGYVIVRYRKNGVLRRFKATPVTAFEFLAAQVVSRFLLIGVVSSFIFMSSMFLIRFQMNGSYLNLILVYSLGALCLISLGLLIAARVKSEELASGLLNLLTWPMMFLSGIWFSLEGANPIMQKLANLSPLTHVTKAARAIMLEGASLAAVAPHLIVLGVLTAVFMTLGSVLFSWD